LERGNRPVAIGRGEEQLGRGDNGEGQSSEGQSAVGQSAEGQLAYRQLVEGQLARRGNWRGHTGTISSKQLVIKNYFYPRAKL
jgi:hypothetical protein